MIFAACLLDIWLDIKISIFSRFYWHHYKEPIISKRWDVWPSLRQPCVVVLGFSNDKMPRKFFAYILHSNSMSHGTPSQLLNNVLRHSTILAHDLKCFLNDDGQLSVLIVYQLN